MTTTDTPPGSPPRSPSDNPRDSPRLVPSDQHHSDTPSSPPEQMEEMPDLLPIDEGPRPDGSLKINFNLFNHDGTRMPVQGVIGLALNEAGRRLGKGMVYYCPSCYPQHPNVPQLFYHSCTWSDSDKDYWDQAPSHQQRLMMMTQVRSEYLVLPIRAVLFDEPQEKIQFTAEDYRLSSVVVTYDPRPFVGWYQEHASRRDNTRGIVAVDLAKHMEWFNSLRAVDNDEIMNRLEEWWNNPITFGLKNYGKTVDKIMGCEEQRRRHSIDVVHKERNEEREDDDTSSEDSDDGGPAAVVPLPLRQHQSLSDEGIEDTAATTPN